MSCIKCRASDDNEKISCDGCDRQIHVACAGLNTHELKVMTLRGGKRTLKYYCDECQQGVRLVPKLLNKIDALEERINMLSNQTVMNTDSRTENLFVEELMERQSRASNILVFNLPESNQDNNNVEKILYDLIQENVTITESARIGKKNKKGIRALKITLPNQSVATKIITAKKDKIKPKNIYISADLTKSQRDHLNNLKEELRTRRENGEEDIVIRYVKGTPKIVNKTLN